jgi:type I restriction enzyme S subunit
LAAFAPATGQKNINLETLGSVHVPCAPLEEQAEVVSRIEGAFARMDQLAAEAERVGELVIRLDRAVLAKAFAGELLSQDATQEAGTAIAAE